MAATATITYNGSGTATARIVGATIGRTYDFYSSDPDSSGSSVVASSTSFDIVRTGIGGMADGTTFDVGVTELFFPNQNYIASTVMRLGVPGQYGFNATFVYDGSITPDGTMEVTFFAEAGVNYRLDVFGEAFFYGTPIVGAGAEVTITETLSPGFPPTVGSEFMAFVWSDNLFPDPWGYFPVKTRLFYWGTASAGIRGNPEAPALDRFYDDPEWRFVLADLDMIVLTILDRLATNRTVTVTLNAPRIHEARVLSNNPKVNILHTDGHPYLDEGDRFVFGLRRDGTAPPWTCRFAGIVDLVDTQAEGDNAYTRYVARDPRQMMFKRPVRDAAGLEPGEDGWTLTGETGRDILVQLLDNSETYDGPTYIDFTTGTELNDTAVIPEIVFQQGMTVGEAWEELEKTGTIDTVLTPKFDAYQTAPITIVTLETYPQVGEVKHAVIMSWDKPGRTLVGISNQRDGSGRENEIRFHFGQGGAAAATLSDSASQARFGVYFAERFFPGQTAEAAVDLIVEKELEAFRNGKRTVAVTPAPRKAKQPFVDYNPGDRIAVNASNALLEDIDTTQRVLVMPIQVDDEGGERVSGLLFTDDGWEGS